MFLQSEQMLIYNDNKKGGIRNENMADYRMFQRTWKRNRNGRPEARGKGCGNCQGREETSGIYKKISETGFDT